MLQRPGLVLAALLTTLIVGAVAPITAAAPTAGQLEIKVVDKVTGRPIACRMHLKNAKGRTVKPPRTISASDHFILDGSILLKLPKGNYTFEVERGLEYLHQTGHFTIENFADDSKTIELNRFVDMAAAGWWSGDLNLRRSERELDAIVRSEDLHIAPLVSVTEKANAWEKSPAPGEPLRTFPDFRFSHLFSTSLGSADNALLLHNSPDPLFPSENGDCRPASLLQSISDGLADNHVWLDVASPTSWDLPVLLARGEVDSIELAHSNILRDGSTVKNRVGRPSGELRHRDAPGEGILSHDIYYHVLNCGLQIPPSAGSGSGDNTNPPGYNRVYVYAGEEPTYESWWEGLRAGRVVVTNGPLLRPNVNGRLPGHTFDIRKGEKLELEIGLDLSTRDRIEYLEIIKNGQVLHEVRLSEWKDAQGRLPIVAFEESGWMLVRAVASSGDRYRFASSGPYYVQVDGAPRVSRASAKYFLQWIDEREANLSASGDQCDEYRESLEQAKTYWREVAARATAP